MFDHRMHDLAQVTHCNIKPQTLIAKAACSAGPHYSQICFVGHRLLYVTNNYLSEMVQIEEENPSPLITPKRHKPLLEIESIPQNR